MSELLEFARGPLFLITFSLMVAGLLRHVVLRTHALLKVRRRTPKRDVPWKKIARYTAGWVVPVSHWGRGAPLMSITSFVFHVGLIAVPVLLAAHVFLWERGVGVSWPTLGSGPADVLTLVTIAAAAVLLVFRTASRTGRALSGFGDYALLLVVALPFVSGYFASHPESSPLAYRTMMLIHVLSGELVFVLMPFTKLAHVVLWPFDRISPEIFWRLVPGAGDAVARELRGTAKGAEA
jgi:hypothetical protein